jgi:hypothetical protein
MDAEPLPFCPAPAYPTRREFLAAGAALLIAAGCGRSHEPRATVAPIFEHGEGRGAAGCIVTNPPVFMSEEEALQVIKEELAKQGIRLGDGMLLSGVELQCVGEYCMNVCWLGSPKVRKSFPIMLDAVDRKTKVGVEFVSQDRYDRFTLRLYYSSVTLWEPKTLAGEIADVVRSKGKDDLRIGVFYDPVATMSWDDVKEEKPAKPLSAEEEEKRASDRWQRVEDAAKKKSRAMLRQQVQDFAVWLKRQ